MRLSMCVGVCALARAFVHASVYLSVSPSLRLSVSPSLCLCPRMWVRVCFCTLCLCMFWCGSFPLVTFPPLLPRSLPGTSKNLSTFIPWKVLVMRLRRNLLLTFLLLSRNVAMTLLCKPADDHSNHLNTCASVGSRSRGYIIYMYMHPSSIHLLAALILPCQLPDTLLCQISDTKPCLLPDTLPWQRIR